MAKSSWTGRTISRFIRWLDRSLPPPTYADLERAETDWEYAQANLQPWDLEPNHARLSEALALHAVDPTNAFSALHRLAGEGSPIAMNAIGEDHYYGQGRPVDRSEAERWWKGAYEHGSLRAMINYGRTLYAAGRLTEADAVFRRGAEMGFAPASFLLARVELARFGWKARKRIRAELEFAAAEGSPAAKSRLARTMLLGGYGLRHIPQGWRLTWATARWLSERYEGRESKSGVAS